jgi:hypothetical protein
MEPQVSERDLAMLLLSQRDLVNLGAMLALSAQIPEAVLSREGEIEIAGLD